MKLPKQSANVNREFIEVRYGVKASPTERRLVKPLSAGGGGGGGGGGNPPPGCWPAGTECRVGIQNMVYCCPGNTTWKRQEGWCIGWWDAIPCNPLGR